ncbi:uncharacterized protein DMAD_05754 [Drosophila madeirensis]|uniref:Seminal fluid protein n=1 Tax=Drosophila madeirensis TaxID=30013 RepID=A0AAU9FMY4_DROMD
MRSGALFLLVLLAVFGSLSASIKKEPSIYCEAVIKIYGPQCGFWNKALSCRRFYEDVKHGRCHEQYLETLEK